MNILLAIDTAAVSQQAVRFVGDVCGKRASDGISVTVFHVVESLPDFILSRAGDAASGNVFRDVAREWSESNRNEGERLLADCRQTLIEAGVPSEAIETKLVIKDSLPEAKKVVAALAIIDEMQTGNYSVVCLGRRGTSVAAGTFPGSVAEKVLREAHGKTVWVVD